MILRKEENGVKWSVEEDEKGRVVNNVMEFNNQVVTGNWVGPQWIFRALCFMSLEERTQACSHDEWMGVIGRKIREGIA